MVYCVGEILVDLIGTQKDNAFCYERHAGGAPFNVATGIATLGGNSGFYGLVGDDIPGKFLRDFASTLPISDIKIEVDSKRNTTLAFVELDKSGERNFCFMRKNGADYNFDVDTVDFPKGTKIVHIGSLMLSEPKGRDAAMAIMNKAKEVGLLVSFDVNYRDDIFPDANIAVQTYKQFIDYADILKMSEDELYMFSGETDIKSAVNNIKKDGKLLCITLGAKGSLYCYGNSTNIVPSIQVDVVDTTGAGDAFFAGVLYNLVEHDFSNLTEEILNKTFRFANICGALATTKKGAITALPKLENVLSK